MSQGSPPPWEGSPFPSLLRTLPQPPIPMKTRLSPAQSSPRTRDDGSRSLRAVEARSGVTVGYSGTTQEWPLPSALPTASLLLMCRATLHGRRRDGGLRGSHTRRAKDRHVTRETGQDRCGRGV